MSCGHAILLGVVPYSLPSCFTWSLSARSLPSLRITEHSTDVFLPLIHCYSFPLFLHLHISVCHSAYHLPLPKVKLVREGEKRIGKKKTEHYYQIFLTSAVSPYGHHILLQTSEALGLFQRCRDIPVLNSDLDNFKSFIPIKPDKLGQKPNSIPKWRWKTKHRNILEHSCFLQLLSYSIRIIC